MKHGTRDTSKRLNEEVTIFNRIYLDSFVGYFSEEILHRFTIGTNFPLRLVPSLFYTDLMLNFDFEPRNSFGF